MDRKKEVNALFILFFVAAINLAKLKLFRHYYVLVSKKKNQKTKSVNKISERPGDSGHRTWTCPWPHNLSSPLLKWK